MKNVIERILIATSRITIIVLSVATQASFSQDDLISDRGEIPQIAANVQAQERTLESGAQGKRERYTVPANTECIRIRLHLGARSDGFGTLLKWDNLELAAEYQENMWTLMCLSPDSTEWVETEFSLFGDSFPGFVDIDLVRTADGGGERRALFVDGTLIVNAGRVASSSANTVSYFEVFQLDFADVRVEKAIRHAEKPEFVARGLTKIRSKEGLENIHLSEPEMTKELVAPDPESQLLSDEVRRELFDLPRFLRAPYPGELSFEEQAWYRTRTVDRVYYEYDPGFRVEMAQVDSLRLTQMGADVLPILEGRSWTKPLAYENWADFYIEKISGYVVPEQTGSFTFFLSADEQASFFLSSPSYSETLELIAMVTEPSEDQWDKEAAQVSEPIFLEAGEPYYFEIWHVEKTGEDYLRIAWELPNGDVQAIPSRFLSATSAGEPGTFPRKGLYPTHESFLAAPTSLPPDDDGLNAVAVTYESPNYYLHGADVIESTDFVAPHEWLFHAWEGSGLGWLWSNSSNYPNLSSGGFNNGSVYYQGNTANPQWFYDYTTGLWLQYFATTTSYYYTNTNPSKWDFEASLVDWTTTPAWWIRHSGGTTSNPTGPTVDHTKKNSSGFYVYLETSSSYANTNGDVATLDGPWVTVSNSGTSVVFYYHMYGSQIGTLELKGKDKLGNVTTLWSKSAQQQSLQSDPFYRAEIDLSTFSGYPGNPVKLSFVGTAAGGYYGDMAIDDVMVFDHGVDSDGDGMLDGFELGNGFDPNTSENPLGDLDEDLISDHVENLSGINGIDGLNSGAWTANNNLQHVLNGTSYTPVIVVPGQGVMGVDPNDLSLTPLSF